MRNIKLPENLQGNWIWGGHAPLGQSSQHVLLRRDFTFDETPGESELWIASYANYILYVNGRFFQTGPSPHPGNGIYATHHDITHLLQIGSNSLAIHAYYDGCICTAHKSNGPNLWCQLICDGRTVVSTDQSWHSLDTDCFQDSGFRASASFASTEIIDFRRYPPHWQTGSITKSPSSTAPVKAGADAQPSWMPPGTCIPIAESRDIMEPEPRSRRYWDMVTNLQVVAKGTYRQKNEVLAISFADCFKEQIPHGLYAAEAYVYCTSGDIQTAICVCDEQYRLFINDELVKSQASPAPAARNLPNSALPHPLPSELLVNQELQVELKIGWNRILLLQHCSSPHSGMTIIWADLLANAFSIHRKPNFGAPHGWNLAGPLNAPLALINPQFPLDNLPKIAFASCSQLSLDAAAFYLACEFQATSTCKLPVSHIEKDCNFINLPQVLHTGETLILDFGKTIYGLPEIRLNGKDGDIVDIVLGTHRLNNEIIALENGHRRNISTAILKQSSEPITWMPSYPAGFRYIMFIVRKATDSVCVRQLFLRISMQDNQNEGSFSCSDPLLTQIWDIGVNTLNVTSQYGFLDSPNKDFAQCIPDAMIQSWAAYFTHGDYDGGSNALAAFAKSQIETGELNSMAPSGFFQAVPDYSLLWPVWLQRHIMHTGNLQFLNTMFPTVTSLLAYYNQIAVSPDGPLGSLHDLLGTYCFLDHDPVIDRDGISAGLNAIYCKSLLAASWLAEQAEQEELAQTYKNRANHVAHQIRLLCWDADQGLFADAYQTGEKSAFHSWQTNVLAIYGGIAPQDAIFSIWKKLFSVNEPYENFANGEYNNPYFKYFILESAFALGKSTWGIDLIRNYWGKMAQAGATTWWELFDPDNPSLNDRTISKCHGYGVSANAFIISELVGIRPAEPGLNLVYFNPLPGIVTWVKATIPTPNGTISVSWSLRPDGIFDASISATFPLEIIPMLNPDIAESAVFKVSEKVNILEPSE